MATKFKQPPLSTAEKEKKAQEIIEGAYKKHLVEPKDEKIEIKTKTIFLRAPETYYNDLQEIMHLTGVTMNALCLELLRPAIKERLKELKES